MKRVFWALGAVVAIFATVDGVRANTVGTLGDATGDLVIHYNTGGETPANQAYITTANSVFNFNENLTSGSPGYGSSHIFQSVANQFQFALSTLAPTYNGSNPYTGPVTALHANQHDTNVSTQSQTVDWAITDPTYFNATSGRTGNSVLRGGDGNPGNGSSIQFNESVTQSGTIFTLNLNGLLFNDGKLWWASATGSNGNGTSNFADPTWNAVFGTGPISFHGTLTYDSSTDTNPLADVYQGTISFDLPATPLPSSMWGGLGLLGLVVGAGYTRTRKAHQLV